jgi:CheY-like chemotaxis protein
MELDKKSTTILVADDNTAIRMRVKQLLEIRGYTVFAAGDAGTAMRLHKEHERSVRSITLRSHPAGSVLEVN